MSGAMIKMGVYGLLRIGLDVLGGGPAWWGALVIGLGALSAVLGVLYALTEDDLKRLLAYSSVENVGVIALGVGAAFLFQSLQMLPAAAFALAAALFHAGNHAAFKGLLFMGAGAVLHATGTRNMNRLGGLIRGMPWTAALFLLGSVAIAGLPPLNGFVSEWLLFQALLPGIGASSPLVAVLMVLALGMLALTAGLAAACFVKAFGITFLAIPRSPEAAAAHETAWSMRTGMIMLAAACLVLSAGSFAVLPRLSAVAAPLVGLPAPGPVLRAGLTLQTPDGLAQMSPGSWRQALASSSRGVGCREAFASRRLPGWATWGCGAWSRRRGWSTRRRRSPSRCAASSPNLPADRGREHRLPSGFALLRALYLVSLGHPHGSTIPYAPRSRAHGSGRSACSPSSRAGACLSRLPGGALVLLWAGSS
jgi:hydrogenase-4 component B